MNEMEYSKMNVIHTANLDKFHYLRSSRIHVLKHESLFPNVGMLHIIRTLHFTVVQAHRSFSYAGITFLYQLKLMIVTF